MCRFVKQNFTLMLQDSDVLDFLAETLAVHRRGLKGPSILPCHPHHSACVRCLGW